MRTYLLNNGKSVTLVHELDRTGTVSCLAIREAGVVGHAPLLASMPLAHVAAPILTALGFAEDAAADIAGGVM